MVSIFSRHAFRLALIGAASLPLAACGPESGFGSRGLESVHQPVVEHQSYTYDIRTDDGLRLDEAEGARLTGWLDSLGAGYGDTLALTTGGAGIPTTLRGDIAALVGARGLGLLEDAAPTGTAPDGVIRLVLRRAVAHVPGCPDWSTRQESDMVGGTSSNFGCGVNGNLAAMVADPDDLLRGRSSDSVLRSVPGSKAIDVYTKKKPTGEGGLKALSATGTEK